MVESVGKISRCLHGLTMGESVDVAVLSDSLKELLRYLSGLVKKHARPDYEDGYLSSKCFDRRVFFKREDLKNYCRAHLVLGVRYFELLVKEIEGELSAGSSEDNLLVIKRYSDVLSDYVYDFKRPVEFLERLSDPDYSFINGWSSPWTRSTDLYFFSKALAKSSFSSENFLKSYHRQSQVAAAFVLRQALELKFERIVGELSDRLGKSPKLNHGFYYDFVNRNKQFFEFPEFDFSLLSNVYNWCSTVVHRGHQPVIWQLPYAYDLCDGIFAWGDFSRGGGRTCNGGVRVLDVDGMQLKFLSVFFEEVDKRHKSPAGNPDKQKPVDKIIYWSVTLSEPEAADFSGPA